MRSAHDGRSSSARPGALVLSTILLALAGAVSVGVLVRTGVSVTHGDDGPSPECVAHLARAEGRTGSVAALMTEPRSQAQSRGMPAVIFGAFGYPVRW